MKITLMEGDEIISTDPKVAETFNHCFTNVVENLNITGFVTDYSENPELVF